MDELVQTNHLPQGWSIRSRRHAKSPVPFRVFVGETIVAYGEDLFGEQLEYAQPPWRIVATDAEAILKIKAVQEAYRASRRASSEAERAAWVAKNDQATLTAAQAANAALKDWTP